MKNIGLKWKVAMAAAVPFFFFIILALLEIKSVSDVRDEAILLHSKLNVIEAASLVVHESQKERGKSSIYLNGGDILKGLNEQRALNDKRLKELKRVVESSAFTLKRKKEVLTAISNINELRNRVTKKSIKLSSALSQYTRMIKSLLDIQVQVARDTNKKIIGEQLLSLKIIEDAKESGGKLRAHMSGALAKDKALNNKKFNTIVKLKAGVDTNINSSLIIKDEKTSEMLAKFKKSNSWKQVNIVFSLILKKSETGSFGKDPKVFFNLITIALNQINDLVVHSRAELQRKIKEIEKVNDKKLNLFIYSLVGTIVIILLFIIYIGRVSSQSIESIKKVSGKLISESEMVSKSSTTISEISTDLSSRTTQQAACLQETVSTIDEISAMVERNAQAANHSTEISQRSHQSAMLGQKTVENMSSIIKEISTSIESLIEEVERNNDDIANIVKLISEIDEKTEVINDIAFQTKLLSFNASVEAARAGENGKGFAVVAEEVGTLANTSGNAALEISTMLETSIKDVNRIVESSKEKISDLVLRGKENIDKGLRAASECSSALNEIITDVDEVNSKVKEIAIASNEQSTGIEEVNKAILELDDVTNQNAQTAQQSSVAATELQTKAQTLHEALDEMLLEINGRRKKKI